METLWYSILLGVVCIYFVLDGYDFGVGVIHLFFAKTEEQKKLIGKAAGLFWDYNEVWLVAAGGLLFMAFPVYYASVFSGFYLPLIILLWLFIFRAVGVELRHQFDHPVWTNFWDKSFGVSSLLLAVFSGAALGNIVRGVNLGQVEDGVSTIEPHYFFLPLWNNSFSPLVEEVGVLDWFTVIIALIALVLLTMHGAAWIIFKTRSSLVPRLRKLMFRLNFVLLVLTIISALVWSSINPDAFGSYGENPVRIIFPLIFVGGLISLFFLSKSKKEFLPFLITSCMIVSGIIASFLSMYPNILPSVNNVNEPLTIYNSITSDYALSFANVWIVIGMVLALGYFLIQKNVLSGKLEDLSHDH